MSSLRRQRNEQRREHIVFRISVDMGSTVTSLKATSILLLHYFSIIYIDNNMFYVNKSNIYYTNLERIFFTCSESTMHDQNGLFS
jgi:hypothetical protein